MISLNKTYTILLLFILFHIAGCYREKRKPLIKLPVVNGVVTVYDRDRAFDGYNVIDGEIFDMNGLRVSAYPGRQCVFYKNGDIAAGVGEHLEMYTANMNKLWRTPDFQHKGVHHEICLDADSNILFLSSEIDPLTIPPGTPVSDVAFKDTLTKDVWYCHLNAKDHGSKLRYESMIRVSRKGEIISKWSSYECLSELKKMIAEHWNPFYADTLSRLNPEYFHFNAIQALPHNPYENSNPAFKAGNLLLNELYFDMLLILDPVTYKILWVYFEPAPDCHVQHSARMLPTGNILLYINQCPLYGNTQTKYSKVIELNPVTKKIEWEYAANPPQLMYGDFGGHVQRLSNGNTLITVDVPGSDTTRQCETVEITRSKEIVWQWFPETGKFQKPGLYRVNRISKKEMAQFIRSKSEIDTTIISGPKQNTGYKY